MQIAALNSATQHTMPPEFGRKWGTECHNTMLPLPTLLCAGYSVKQKKILNKTKRIHPYPTRHHYLDCNFQQKTDYICVSVITAALVSRV